MALYWSAETDASWLEAVALMVPDMDPPRECDAISKLEIHVFQVRIEKKTASMCFNES